MRGPKLLIAAGLLASLLAGVVLAGPRYEKGQMLLTNTATNTVYLNPQGRILEVLVAKPSTGGVAIATAAATGTVTVISTPAVNSGLTATTLFTSTVTNNTLTTKPRFAPTDNTGSALSSLTVYEPLLCVGDSVAFKVIQEATGMTNVLWQVWLKVE